jgi:hypothetical protein
MLTGLVVFLIFLWLIRRRTVRYFLTMYGEAVAGVITGVATLVLMANAAAGADALLMLLAAAPMYVAVMAIIDVVTEPSTTESEEAYKRIFAVMREHNSARDGRADDSVPDTAAEPPPSANRRS